VSAPGQSVRLPRPRREPLAAVRAALAARPRLWVYAVLTLLAVLVNYLLGKEMMWDTLDYHFYAGFSALHDRFGRDYFAAGVQTYFNPYVYVPFYALVRTGLPSLVVASLLAVAQSVIFWITYELALAVAPADEPRWRLAAAACAALLAFANPILIDQLGSSYADITTSEIVLAAWLLLIHAVRTPGAWRIAAAGLLLGLASALKLTNSLHALSACVLLLFLPTSWRGKLRSGLAFGAAMTLGFALVAVPWAIRLEHHFGNPFFPLFNSVFRSPQFPTTPMLDYRFVPDSLREALMRPFAIVAPVTFVDDEYAAPDLRYALLLVLAVSMLVRWVWKRMRSVPGAPAVPTDRQSLRALTALGCAFLIDWSLWLTISGNGRYFLAMACVAGILAVGLAFRLLRARPKALGYLMVALFAAQVLQLVLGASFRLPAAWDGGPWFEITVPPALRKAPDLFFSVGEESNSFIAPYLARGSGFVNLDGDYVLGPQGANGAHIERLVHRYAGHLRVAELESQFDFSKGGGLPDLAHVDDTLAPFGLRSDAGDCSTIIIHDVRHRWRKVLPGTLPIHLAQLQGRILRVPVSPDGYLVTCRVVPDPASRVKLAQAQREPDLAFDRLESECPRLFQPPHPVTEAYGDSRRGYLWMRKYPGTNLAILISGGSIRFVDGARGGRPDMLGRESDWARGPVPVVCGRRGESYFARLVSPAP
jgi:hypothetical protein